MTPHSPLNKIQADIYKIDEINIRTTSEALINQIIENHNGQDYINLTLREEIRVLNGFQVKLYVNDIVESPPDWTLFLKEMTTIDGVEAIDRLQRKYPSFLLFFYRNREIYVLTKGAGRFVIVNYIQENFGIEILERLVNPSDSDLRSLQERGVIGSVLAAQKYFKPDHKFSDEQSFGKFYKSIEASISKDDLENDLGVRTDRKTLIVNGENTLKINTRITISEIAARVAKISHLLTQDKKVHFNKFKRISSKKLSVSRNGEQFEITLNNALIEKAYDEFTQEPSLPIYHPEIFRYLESSGVMMTFEDQETEFDLSEDISLELLFARFGIQVTSLIEFTDHLANITTSLVFENEAENPYRTSLRSWLIGEIEINNQKYFKFDGNWFSYENDFLLEINTLMDKLITKLGTPEVLPSWTQPTEGEYNQSFRTNQHFLVCDRATVSNIEICDFMQFDLNGQGLRLYHVKDGWGQSIRVVYNQIMNGARFIAEIQNNSGRQNNQKIQAYYDKIVRTHYSDGVHAVPVTFDQFRGLINRKKITFVLVYGHRNQNDRDTQIRQSTSNIAKLSIIQCENELRASYDFGFDIIKAQR